MKYSFTVNGVTGGHHPIRLPRLRIAASCSHTTCPQCWTHERMYCAHTRTYEVSAIILFPHRSNTYGCSRTEALFEYSVKYNDQNDFRMHANSSTCKSELVYAIKHSAAFAVDTWLRKCFVRPLVSWNLFWRFLVSDPSICQSRHGYSQC